MVEYGSNWFKVVFKGGGGGIALDLCRGGAYPPPRILNVLLYPFKNEKQRKKKGVNLEIRKVNFRLFNPIFYLMHRKKLSLPPSSLYNTH